jgi:cation transport ATPase
VIVLRWRFQYFCSAECEQTFRERVRSGDESIAIRTTPSPRATTVRATPNDAHPANTAGVTQLTPSSGASANQDAGTSPSAGDAQRLLALRIATLGLSCLQLSSNLASTLGWFSYLRIGLAISTLVALGASERIAERRITARSAEALFVPAAFCGLLVFAVLTESEQLALFATCGALASIAVCASRWWLSVSQANAQTDLQQLLQHGGTVANRLYDGQPMATPADDLRPGQELVLCAGDSVPVDVVIASGSARVRPWMNADHTRTCAPGDPVLAGAQILEGTAQAVVTWTGTDRVLLRLLLSPDAAAETHGAASRWSALVKDRLSWPISLLVLLLLSWQRAPWEHVLAIALVARLWLANPVSARAAALELRKVAMSAARQGIAFHDAKVLDRAGAVSIAVFCSRGTLLLATPELIAVEGLGRTSAETVFALAAGALSSVAHPNAQALYRAAQARNIVADAVRNHDHLPGLGVTAVSATGQSLVVGNRALMLKQKISVASAEQRLLDLEARGLSVLLAALDQRLIGFVALQDGVRRGVRAAVMELHEAHIEPVMLSGDARETCEAVGKAIGIDHIRPEVLPAERSNEIKRLRDAGAVVAVIGKSPADVAALAAADVSIGLGAAGSTVPGIGIALAADDPQAAARALTLARTTKLALRGLLLAILLPGGFGMLLAFLGVPAWLVLVLVLVGMALGVALPIVWLPRFARNVSPP